VLFPYGALDQAVRMTAKNYDPNLGTPLYDQTTVLLGTVVAKAHELRAAGIAVRTVTLLITDGADCGSQRCRASDVRTLVDDLLAGESHVVAAMGISDGTTNFRKVFADMGIPDRWVLTPSGTASEIRRAFQVFSRSAVAIGSGAAALGGFAS
jgi:hypothetical protein